MIGQLIAIAVISSSNCGSESRLVAENVRRLVPSTGPNIYAEALVDGKMFVLAFDGATGKEVSRWQVGAEDYYLYYIGNSAFVRKYLDKQDSGEEGEDIERRWSVYFESDNLLWEKIGLVTVPLSECDIEKTLPVGLYDAFAFDSKRSVFFVSRHSSREYVDTYDAQKLSHLKRVRLKTADGKTVRGRGISATLGLSRRHGLVAEFLASDFDSALLIDCWTIDATRKLNHGETNIKTCYASIDPDTGVVKPLGVVNATYGTGFKLTPQFQDFAVRGEAVWILKGSKLFMRAL